MKAQTLKTGGVDGCECDETLRLISEGKMDTTPLITHTSPFSQIEAAYDIFENHLLGIQKLSSHESSQEIIVISQEKPEIILRCLKATPI